MPPAKKSRKTGKKNQAKKTSLDSLTVEEVPIDEVRPNPENYREHPDDQIEHLIASQEQFGVYRNVVLAKDGTILAGHGVVEAAVRLDIDPDSVEARKLMVVDNEVSRLAFSDDRALSELLREIMHNDEKSLLGTGFDENALAALVMVTRPKDEIEDIDEAREWVGVQRLRTKRSDSSCGS